MPIADSRPASSRRRSLDKERRWRAHLARQAALRLTVREYCRRHAISEPSFYAWRREIAKRDGLRASLTAPSSLARKAKSRAAAVSSPASAFVRVEAAATTPRSPVIEIVLPGDVRVRVPSKAATRHLRKVLAALGIDAGDRSRQEDSAC